MASVRIIRLKESSFKEPVLPLELTLSVTDVLTDLDAKINSFQHFRTLVSALVSHLPNILFLVTKQCGQEVYQSDVQEVKMVRDRGNDGVIPTIVLRKDFQSSEGVIDYEGMGVTFELKGRKLMFGLREDGSEG